MQRPRAESARQGAGPLACVADQFGPSVVVLAHNTTVTCNGLRRFSTREYAEFVFDFVKERDLRAIIVLSPDDRSTAEQCAQIAQLARERAAWQG